MLYQTFVDYLINTMSKAVIIIDKNGIIKSYNRVAEELLEVKKEDAVGYDIKTIIPNTGLYDVLATQKTHERAIVEYRDKKIIGVRHPIFSDGQIVGAISLFHDIEKQELVMDDFKTIQEINEELETIIEACSEGIYVTDESGIGIRANTALYNLYGFQIEDLIGRNIGDLVKEGTISDSATLKVMASNKPASIIQVHKSGKRFLNTGRPIFDQAGKLVKTVVTVRDVTELNHLVEDLKKSNEKNEQYYRELMQLRASQHPDMVASSKAMQNVVDMAMMIANVESGCLLLGESGVGKEVAAKLIHNSGNRKDKPFIKVNCGAIPGELLESEMFGHEDGAFSGARKGGKLGMFELANGGTLFLDEIGEMPLALQVKLLQVLQDMALYRLGGTKLIRVNVRIVAATNRDLTGMIRAGQFREDLYYRLNVVSIEVPPLRERTEDIIPLVDLFTKQINKKYGMDKQLGAEAIQAMLSYHWPGNVRELKNVIERSLVTSRGELISTRDLPPDMWAGETLSHTNKKLKQAMAETEKKIIADTLREHRSIRESARVLGVDPSTIFRKAKKYDIDVEYIY